MKYEYAKISPEDLAELNKLQEKLSSAIRRSRSAS